MSQSELLHARAGYFYFCLSKSKLDACFSERREKTNQTAHKNNLNYVFFFFSTRLLTTATLTCHLGAIAPFQVALMRKRRCD